VDTITLLKNGTLLIISKGKVNCLLKFLFTEYFMNTLYVTVLYEGSTLPMAEDVTTNMSTFLNTAKMSQNYSGGTPNQWKLWWTVCETPGIKWLMTTIKKWSTWQSNGTLTLHYVRSEKMIKMEVSKDEPENEDNIDNNLTSCNKRKRKDIGSYIWITIAAISVFPGYLKKFHNICMKHRNILNLQSKTLNKL